MSAKKRSGSNEFREAMRKSKLFADLPTTYDQLELYALYRQALWGDCDQPRPGLQDFEGKSKWDRWCAHEGEAMEDAERAYIAKVEALACKLGLKERHE